MGAFLKEIKLRKSFLSGQKSDTVYLGGGTPSLLDERELARILDEIHQQYQLEENTEYTIEANPDDLDRNRLETLKSLGFNRISMGIQSFREADLKLMNRRHSASQASRCVQEAHQAGFEHISVDLIYGIPGLDLLSWKENLLKIQELPVDHLSAYHLTIEPGTRFGKWKREGRLVESGEEESVRQYELLRETSAAMGFEQYEISNFARNKQYSRHNTKYWSGASYLGLGPSAHSYNGEQRLWNPSNLKKYIEAYKNGESILEKEEISPTDKRNELLMTGLRTIWGVTEPQWQQLNHPQTWSEMLSQTQIFIDSGDLVLNQNRLTISPESWFRADGIIGALFLVE